MDSSTILRDDEFDFPETTAKSSGGLRFCRRCRLSVEGDPASTSCLRCGDSLMPQGYCPICESYVLQTPGEFCQKHDVSLEEGEDPGPHVYGKPGDSIKWVTLETYLDRSRAEGLRIRLEAEGIPTFVDGERMGSMSMYQVATGGVRLQVPEGLVDDARIILSQSWAPPFQDEDDDLEDAWGGLEPEPGLSRRFVMKGFILYWLLAPILLYPIVMIVVQWIRLMAPALPRP